VFREGPGLLPAESGPVLECQQAQHCATVAPLCYALHGMLCVCVLNDLVRWTDTVASPCTGCHSPKLLLEGLPCLHHSSSSHNTSSVLHQRPVVTMGPIQSRVHEG
jgi:hypothetical protein